MSTQPDDLAPSASSTSQPLDYEAPAITPLGTIAELTQGGTDLAADQFGGSGDEGWVS